MHKEDTKQQKHDPDQAYRVERRPFDSESAERIRQVGADHLTENRSTDDDDDTHLGDRNDRPWNKTDTERAAEVCPERGGLKPAESGSGAPESAGRHDAQKNETSREKGYRCAEHRRVDSNAQPRVDWTLDRYEEASNNHDEDDQESHIVKIKGLSKRFGKVIQRQLITCLQ